jgi:hypothetical protein
MKAMFRLFVWSLALTMFLGSAQICRSQTVNASLGGIVNDQFNARIPGASVVLLNLRTKDTREAITNAEGAFQFNAVPSGSYSLSIESAGFRKLVTKEIALHPNDSVQLTNLKMIVGASDVSIVVEASNSGIGTSGERSQLISSKDITKQSTVGRDVTELLRTQPGFAMVQSGLDNGPSSSAEVAGSYSGLGNYVGSGSTANGTSVISDGANVTDPGSGAGQTQTVNMDAVEEVKIETSNFGADVAKGPTVITAVGKSGSSSAHGAIHIYSRTNQMNAQDWFVKRIGNPQIPDRYIYPGVDLGGPLRIPGTKFNQSNKITFQFNGEDYIQRNVYSYGSPLHSFINALVPTENMRNGDFNQGELATYLGTDTNTIESQCTSSGTFSNYYHVCAAPTTNANQITVDSNVKALLNIIPLPNKANTDGYNYTHLNLENSDSYQLRGRLDFNLNSNNKLYMVYGGQFGTTSHIPEQIYYSPASGGGLEGGIDTPGKINSSVHSHMGSLNYTHIFNSRLTNEAFASLSNVKNVYVAGDFEKLTASYYGYAGNYIFPSATKEIPQFSSYNVAGLPLAIIPDFSNGPFTSRKFIPAFGDNVSYLWRTHTFKVGAYLERDTANQTDLSPITNGAISQYYIGTQTTTNPNGSTVSSVGCAFTNCGGNYLADFFEGIIQEFTQQNFNAKTDLYYWSNAAYVTDSWKITRKITVDVGVRFEHQGAWSDQHGIGIATFSPSLYAKDATNTTNADGTLFLPGVRWRGGKKSTNGNAGYTQVSNSGAPSRVFFYSPRFGVSWNPYGDGKVVVRGGWGQYRGHDSWNDYVGAAATSEGLVTVLANTGSLTLENIPQSTTYGCNANTTSGCPSIFAIDPTDNQQPLTTTYSFSVTRQLPHDFVFDVGYVGNHSDHLLTDNISNTSLQTGDMRNVDAVPIGAMLKPDPNPSSTYYGRIVNPDSATTAQTNDYRPYPAYSGLGVPRHILNANYNGLQTSINRQRGRFNLGANYTWSRALGIRGGFNNGYSADPNNLHQNYGPLAFDRTHITAASYSYDEGNMFHLSHRFFNGLVNGWFISGITNFQSGPNIPAVYGANLQLTGTTQYQSNGYACSSSTNGCNIDSKTILGTPDIYLMPIERSSDLCPSGNPVAHLGKRQFINGYCFALPPSGVNGPGNLGNLRGPAYFNSDLSLQRSFAMRERGKLLFRASGFNFMNHPITAFSSRFTNEVKLQMTGTTFDDVEPVNKTNSNGGTCSAYGSTCFGYAGYKTGRRVMEVSVRYEF